LEALAAATNDPSLGLGEPQGANHLQVVVAGMLSLAILCTFGTLLLAPLNTNILLLNSTQ
jgi:hypothetical protein